MASILSDEDQALYEKYMYLYPTMGSLWVGLQGNARDSGYAGTWVDGSAVGFTNWYAGEPNGWARNCVEMWWPSGKWNDRDCKWQNMPFICVKARSSIAAGDGPVANVDASAATGFSALTVSATAEVRLPRQPQTEAK